MTKLKVEIKAKQGHTLSAVGGDVVSIEPDHVYEEGDTITVLEVLE